MESELPGDREVYYLQQWRLNSTKLIHKPLKRWFHQLSLTNRNKRTETLKEAFSPPLRPRRTPSLCLLCSCDHKKATTRPRHSELLSPRPKITISWKTVNLWSCQNKQLPSNTMMCHSHFSCSVCHFRSNEDLKLLFFWVAVSSTSDKLRLWISKRLGVSLCLTTCLQACEHGSQESSGTTTRLLVWMIKWGGGVVTLPLTFMLIGSGLTEVE